MIYHLSAPCPFSEPSPSALLTSEPRSRTIRISDEYPLSSKLVDGQSEVEVTDDIDDECSGVERKSQRLLIGRGRKLAKEIHDPYQNPYEQEDQWCNLTMFMLVTSNVRLYVYNDEMSKTPLYLGPLCSGRP